MIWVRRVLSAPTLLVAFVCLVGTARIFSGSLSGSSTGEGVMVTLFALAAGGAACLLLRPDLRRLRGVSRADVRAWFFSNPLGQAMILYAAAALVMAAAPRASLLPALVAQCVFSAASAATAVRARRWWTHALLSVLGFVLLMGALAATGEAVMPQGFGQGAMVFLLPMEAFPVLLILSGLVRRMRRARATP